MANTDNFLGKREDDSKVKESGAMTTAAETVVMENNFQEVGLRPSQGTGSCVWLGVRIAVGHGLLCAFCFPPLSVRGSPMSLPPLCVECVGGVNILQRQQYSRNHTQGASFIPEPD